MYLQRGVRSRPSGAWTWYLTEDVFAYFAHQISAAADAGDSRRLYGLVSKLSTLPLYHGVSADATRLMRLASSRWAHRTRRRAGAATAPAFNAKEYIRAARPRRGVAGRVYSQDDQGNYFTLGHLVENNRRK